MKNLFSRALVTAAVVVGAMGPWVTPAFAFDALPDDVQPPPWRGQPGTTSQYWMFGTDLTTLIPPNGPIPANGSIPAGLPPLPSTHINVQPLSLYIDRDSVTGRSGIWSLAEGGMNVTVDNYPDPNLVKYVRVQVVWQPQAESPFATPVLSGLAPQPYPAGATPVAVPADLPNGWFETTYMWEIRPNPADEFFVLSGNINVDQLLIDTWCIPEPSAGVLTLLGGGLLLVLRRRRQS